MFGDQQPNSRADRDRRGGINQAFAQIEQVLEKRHSPAGVFFGGRRDSGLRLDGLDHRSLSQDLFQPRERQQQQFARIAHSGLSSEFRIAVASVRPNLAPQKNSAARSRPFRVPAAAHLATAPPPMTTPRAGTQAAPK